MLITGVWVLVLAISGANQTDCQRMGLCLPSSVSGEIVRVWVEPPDGWGPTRALLGRLTALGYTVEEHRIFDAVGRSILVITA